MEQTLKAWNWCKQLTLVVQIVGSGGAIGGKGLHQAIVMELASTGPSGEIS